MLEHLTENTLAEVSSPMPAKFNFDWLDSEPKRKKKGKKRKKKGQKCNREYEYAQLAFQYGVLASRYDTLSRMVELSIATKRKQLDDNLLDSSLAALRQPRIISLPER